MKKNFLIKGGIKMAEISAINNFKKYNSGSGRNSINNVVREAFRELEKFKNNVNQELTKFNKILVKDLSVLERQYYDTEVDSRSRDVVSVVSQVQTGNFEAKNGVERNIVSYALVNQITTVSRAMLMRPRRNRNERVKLNSEQMNKLEQGLRKILFKNMY